jgi:hypothetical protein
MHNRQVSFVSIVLPGLLAALILTADIRIFSLLSFRGGRYDSTKRHCKKCIGFRELNTRCRVYPLEITRGEQEAMRIYRKNAKAEDEEKTERLVDSSVNKLLEMMVGPENFRILDAMIPWSFGRMYY